MDVSVHVVWLPMFPRLMEWWALPRMAEEFSTWGIPQYWDDERHLSLEVKERLVRQVDVPELQCRFHWEPGSIAFWDNFAVQHYGVNDYYPERRVMARAAIASRWPR